MTLRADWKDLHDFDDRPDRDRRRLAVDDAADRPAESLDVRRARAIGVLADPATALALLEGTPAPTPREADRAVRPPLRRGHRRPRPRRPLREHRPRRPRATDPVLVRHAPTPTSPSPASSTSPTTPAPTPTRPAAASASAPTSSPATASSRSAPAPPAHCDHDHVVPHGDGGATCDCNIAPLCRRHHRLKTHAGWSLHRHRDRRLALVRAPRPTVPPRPPRHPRRHPHPDDPVNGCREGPAPPQPDR